MKVKVKSGIKWSMCFAPVMSCKGLGLEEKLVLNIIMSMKNSFDMVYATSEKMMEMTGLSSDQYESAVSGLLQKGLIGMKGKEWRIFPDGINSILGVEVYDMKKLNASKNQPKKDPDAEDEMYQYFRDKCDGKPVPDHIAVLRSPYYQNKR